MRRIVIISYKFPPLNSGYGNQALAVLTTITALSSDLDFIVLTAKFHTTKLLNNDERIKTRLFWNRLLNVDSDQTSVVNSLIFQIQIFLWLLLNYKSYDIIHCIASGPHYALAVIAGKLLKKQIIIKLTNIRFFWFDEYFKFENQSFGQYRRKEENLKDKIGRRQIPNPFKRIKRISNDNLLKIILRANVFIAVSHSIAKELLVRGVSSKKIRKIPNGVDSNYYAPAKSPKEKYFIHNKLNLENDAVIILFAGSISNIKGVSDLVEAIKILNISQKILLVVCGADAGYGPELIKSLYEINKLQNTKAVYKGKIDNINEYYRAADIFVLPSYFEGLPNVLLEAASSGLPLVATDIGGNRDIIEDGFCGFLYPPGDIEKLKQALELLISDKTLRINFGKMARKIAVDKYHLPIIANHYIELYRQI